MAISSPETPLKGAALDAMLANIDEDDPNLIWTLMEQAQSAVGKATLAKTVSTENIPLHGDTAKENFLSIPEEEPPLHMVVKTDYIRPRKTDNNGQRFQRLRKGIRKFLEPLNVAREAIDATELIASEFGGNFVRYVLGYQDEWSNSSSPPETSSPHSHETFGRLDICKVEETGELLIICHAITELSPQEQAREHELQMLDLKTAEDQQVEPFTAPDKAEHGLGLTLIRELSRKEHGVGRYREEGAPDGIYSVWAVVDGSKVTLVA